MLWIVILGLALIAVIVWARASQRRFEAERQTRAQQRERRKLDEQEAALLERLKAERKEED